MFLFTNILLFAAAFAFSDDFAAPKSDIDRTDTREWREQMVRDIFSLEIIILSIAAVIFILTLIAMFTIALRGCYIKRNQYRVRSNVDVLQQEEGINFHPNNRGETYL